MDASIIAIAIVAQAVCCLCPVLGCVCMRVFTYETDSDSDSEEEAWIPDHDHDLEEGARVPPPTVTIESPLRVTARLALMRLGLLGRQQHRRRQRPVRPNIKLEVLQYEGSAESEMCAVCLDNLEPNGEVSRGCECSHTFHHVCLQQWVDSSGKVICPVCRAQLIKRPNS